MSKDTRFLKEALACVLSLSLFALLVVAFEYDVGYEDTWILGGLVVPFLAYVAVGSSVLFFEGSQLARADCCFNLALGFMERSPGFKIRATSRHE